MKPIGNLAGLGSACCRGGRKRARPIPADDRNARILSEPFRHMLAATIGQQVQHPMGFQVHHNRSVRAAFAPGPFVQAHHLRRGWRRGAGRPQDPQQCARTAVQAEFRTEVAPGVAASREGQIA